MSFPKVRALYDYTARSEHELSFNKGDVLTVHEIRDDDWWEGELDGKEGFIAAKYVEHAPTWFYPAETAHSSNKEESDEKEEEDADPSLSLPPPPSSFRSQSPTSPQPVHAKQQVPADRPNLAKAVMMHHTKHKHDIGTSSNAGLHEFKRAFTQIKTKPQQPKPQESELAAVLRKRTEVTQLAELKEVEQKNMPELQRRFSQRFGSNAS
eukprot:m.116281 g.116281  ORF g.116281 m.116281 type:complete len:209 (-) comp15396_c0_seq3:324-950(-)